MTRSKRLCYIPFFVLFLFFSSFLSSGLCQQVSSAQVIKNVFQDNIRSNGRWGLLWLPEAGQDHNKCTQNCPSDPTTRNLNANSLLARMTPYTLIVDGPRPVLRCPFSEDDYAVAGGETSREIHCGVHLLQSLQQTASPRRARDSPPSFLGDMADSRRINGHTRRNEKMRAVMIKTQRKMEEVWREGG